MTIYSEFYEPMPPDASSSGNGGAEDKLVPMPECIGETTIDPVLPVKPIVAGNFDKLERNRHSLGVKSGLNELLADSWMKLIKASPDSFDALLWRPVSDIPSEVDETGFETGAYEQAEFTRLDPHQQELTYSDPEEVCVVDVPDEMDSFISMDAGDDNAGIGDSALVLKIASKGIPIGSVLAWKEDIAGGQTRTAWWYVLRIANYGTTNVGSLYFCIPSRSFEGVITDEH
ncbi:MAG TPA: phage tail protein [Buttiauxella sp.]